MKLWLQEIKTNEVVRYKEVTGKKQKEYMGDLEIVLKHYPNQYQIVIMNKQNEVLEILNK